MVIEIAVIFLRLGLTSFGGPTAHLGYFHNEFVLRRKWVTEREYAELVALCQFLPGPASSQVGFALGMHRGGYPGAIAAWLGFTLPSALLLALLALGIVAGAGAGGGTASGAAAWWQPATVGLAAVVVAVVAQAVWSMARTLTPDLPRVLIGVGAGAISLVPSLLGWSGISGAVGQVTAIVLGALVGLVVCQGPNAFTAPDSTNPPLQTGAPHRVTRRAGLIALGALALVLAGLPLLARMFPIPTLITADAFSRAGAIVFGGGHVVLPLLQAEPAIAQAVPPEEFIAGYGAAQAVPGPLFTFAAYLGAFMGQGLVTSLVALVAIFVPGMLLLIGVMPWWDRLRSFAPAGAAIRGANAAVVGILAAAWVDPVLTTGVSDVWTGVLAVIAFVLLAVLRMPAWLLVLLGAAAGYVLPVLP